LGEFQDLEASQLGLKAEVDLRAKVTGTGPRVVVPGVERRG